MKAHQASEGGKDGDGIISENVIKNLELSWFKRLTKTALQIIRPDRQDLDLSEDKKQQLQIKAEELEKNAGAVLVELREIKEDLKREVDTEYMIYVEAVVFPIIQRISRIQKAIKTHYESKSDQALFDEEWIIQSESYINTFSTKIKDRDEIVTTVIKGIIKASNIRIERDIDLLKNYQEQRLGLVLSKSEQSQLRHIFDEKVFNHIAKLEAMKKKPEVLKDQSREQQFSILRKDVDERQTHLENALHAIDLAFGSLFPNIVHDERKED